MHYAFLHGWCILGICIAQRALLRSYDDEDDTTKTTYIQFFAFFIFSKIYHVFNGKLIFKMKFFFTSVFNFSLDSCCQFSFAALFTPPKAKISIKRCSKSKKRKHIVVCCTKNTYTHLVWISSKWRNIYMEKMPYF